MSGPARVVFMGSPDFAVPSLRALVGVGYDVVLVVTQPDKRAGRGAKMQAPPVKQAAEELGIAVFQPETLRDEAAHARLLGANADVFVVAAYGKILPRAILEIPQRGCLNVHASLLPKWRGPSPIVASILAGEPVTGVSIMELVRKMDAGPVLSRVETRIADDDTAATLEPRLAELGAAELVRILPGWLSGDVRAEPQDENAATYCQLITKGDGWLKTEMGVAEADRAVRAYNPWPGASVLYGEQRLSIWKASLADASLGSPGALRLIERLPAVAFHDGWLALEEVQRPGSKRMAAQQFVAGERGVLLPQVGLA